MAQLSRGRQLALEVTRQVREREAFVQPTIDSVVRNAKGARQEKAFAELLSTGVVSTWGTLDEIINRSLNHPNDIKPDVRDALRISAYELAFLGKQDHAVVDQGVEMVRAVAPKAAGLGNVVLRRIAVDMRQFPWGNPNTDDVALARKLGFPQWMADMLISDLGRNDAVVFMTTSNEPAPVFLAVNSVKAKADEVFAQLEADGARPSYVGPAERGCIKVDDPVRAIRSAVLRDGRAIVSDASAQLAALVATPARGRRFLEVGSGRGTKTVLLQSNALRYNGEQAQMSCVDLHAFKNRVLERRIEECGLTGIELFEGDASALGTIEGLPASFGKALVDTPCSGLGTLRRHPEIRWRLKPEDIDAMARVDLAILRSVAERIEPGGSVVYSTCTVARAENMGVVEAFLASEAGAGFALKPQGGGQPFVQNRLVPGGPDVHFVAQLVRR